MAPVDDVSGIGAPLNAFGVDLFRRLDGGSGNLVVSPASLALALSMAETGARGQTATEIDRALHGFGSGDEGDVVAFLRALDADNVDGLNAAGAPARVELRVANAEFLQRGFPFRQDWVDRLSATFGSPAYLVDFESHPDAARQTINAWGSRETNGRIPAILPPGSVDSTWRFGLANAVYLKADWDIAFKTSATKPRPFKLASGSTVSVATMSAKQLALYAQGTGWRAVTIPYSGGQVSMTVVVPDDIESFVRDLSAEELAAASTGEYDAVDLQLPRFSADSRFALKEPLESLGMTTAFGPQADFSPMTAAEPLQLFDVFHQANVDVDEKGTTAAAVTVVGGGTMGSAPQREVSLRVDRPFVFFVSDNSTGAMLFLGRIDDPRSGR